MSKVLIDTNIIIWWLEDPSQIKTDAREIIENPDNQIYYSVASIWEIEIKRKVGKLNITENYIELIDNELFQCLSILKNHVLKISNLEFHHHDPFDRVLIAQAIEENLTIITSDKLFKKYPVKILPT
jgi:PIN domain nuclease of toxin-antitoxin system